MLAFHPTINPRAYATPQLAARAALLVQTAPCGIKPAADRKQELLSILHELTRRAELAITTAR